MCRWEVLFTYTTDDERIDSTITLRSGIHHSTLRIIVVVEVSSRLFEPRTQVFQRTNPVYRPLSLRTKRNLDDEFRPTGLHEILCTYPLLRRFYENFVDNRTWGRDVRKYGGSRRSDGAQVGDRGREEEPSRHLPLRGVPAPTSSEEKRGHSVYRVPKEWLTTRSRMRTKSPTTCGKLE